MPKTDLAINKAEIEWRRTSEALKAAERKRTMLERDLYLASAEERDAWLAEADAREALEKEARDMQEQHAQTYGGPADLGGPVPVQSGFGVLRDPVSLSDLTVGRLIKFRYGAGERIWGKVKRVGEVEVVVTLANQPVMEAGELGDEVSIPCDLINEPYASGFIFELAPSA